MQIMVRSESKYPLYKYTYEKNDEDEWIGITSIDDDIEKFLKLFNQWPYLLKESVKMGERTLFEPQELTYRWPASLGNENARTLPLINRAWCG